MTLHVLIRSALCITLAWATTSRCTGAEQDAEIATAVADPTASDGEAPRNMTEEEKTSADAHVPGPVEAAVAPNPEIEKSVVKISVTQRSPDFLHPWTKSSPSKSSGSGVVIAGRRILTNAHVVMHASEIFVQLNRGGDQLTAKLVAIAPGIDLALIELEDPSALDGVTPLSLAAELPLPKSDVSVYGYPTGGDDLSVTRGIVSRIEFTGFSYGKAGVRVQVDAALNPGNSGGPAIQNGMIAGLVFSKIEKADNIGYLIPPEEIEAFLSDVADGAYDGRPLMFDSYQSAENDALRTFLNVPQDVTGVVVTEPYSDDEEYPLRKWDLITHIGPHAIDNQGYVEVRPGLRLKFMYYVPRLANDGKIELTILRDGHSQVVQVPVRPDRELLIPVLKDQYPEYFIYGPIVFSPATQEYVRATGGAGVSMLAALDSPILKRLYDKPAEPGEQLVMISTRLFPHPIAKGYDVRPMTVIDKVNGTEIHSLRQLAELLKNNQDEYLRFEMADRNESLVFRREELDAATEEILVDEGIRYQASESLRDVWDD